MRSQLIKALITCSILFTSASVWTQNNSPLLPTPHINGIKVNFDLSFLSNLGLHPAPTEREVDEAYGVDSIYYYRIDSFTLIYLIESGQQNLAGISINCTDCFGLSKTNKIKRGDQIIDLIHIYPHLFAVSNPKKDFTDITKEKIARWLNIKFKIDNIGHRLSIYNYGLVNFSLKDGKITNFDVQYYME